MFALGTAALAQDAELKEKFEKGVYAYDHGDVVAAMSYFRDAAEQDHVGAQLRLGYILDIAGSDREALKWFKRAREQGSAKGAYRLGRLYATGEAGEPDPEAAIELYREAADKGHKQSMYVLGSAFEQGGLGLEADEDKALRWYRRAAEAGASEGIRRMMRAYADGELGLPVDEAMAEKWRKRLPREQEKDDQDSA